MKMKTETKKGFTLIELLIVVAIIAILAAIAVPNFLEAQVRSKVSRVKADMRTMAVAIESYTVDNNRPPIGFNEGVADFGWSDKLQAWIAFTTPISYITSIPKDPFAVYGQGTGAKEAWDMFPYQSVRYKAGAQEVLKGLGFTWQLYSIGPIRKHISNPPTPWVWPMMQGDVPPTNIYDATNGTVSWGMIWRTNKGIGLDGAVKYPRT